MVKAINKNKLTTILSNRPAFIKKVINPSVEFLTKCIYEHHRVINHIDKSLLTLPLLEMVAEYSSTSKGYSTVYYMKNVIAVFPTEVREALSEEYIKALLKIAPDVVTCFPNASYELWVEYAKHSYSLREVPPQHQRDEVLAAILIHGGKSSIPEEAFNDDIADLAIEYNSSAINYLPEKFITTKRLRRVLEKNSSITFNIEIPKEIWTQELADMATASSMSNIRLINPDYITTEMARRVLVSNGSLIQYIPKKVLTDELLIEALCQGERSSTEHKQFPAKCFTHEFMLKLATKDAEGNSIQCYGIKNFLKITGKGFSDAEWIEILTINPKTICLIEKERQSDAIINTFFDHTTIEILNRVASFLNLMRIKQVHCPMMIGTTSSELQKIIERKMKKQSRVKNEMEDDAIGEGEIGLVLTPAEWQEIEKRYLKNAK